MRITDHMLNESARKAGMPINSHNLMDYVKGSAGNTNRLASDPTGSGNRLSKSDKAKYEKMEKAADELDTLVQRLTAEGKDSIWEKYKESGDSAEEDGAKKAGKEVEDLIERYNKLLESMKDSSGALNEFYKKSLKDVPAEYKEALAEIGISAKKDGSLEINQEKFKSASLDQLEKLFGTGSTLMNRLSFISSRIADNADANLESLSGRYSPDGNTTSSYTNKYNFWG